MEKVYRLLPWLTTPQTLAWLRSMTGTSLSSDDLLQLCDAGECSVYLDCRGREGDGGILISDSTRIRRIPVTGQEVCKVENPLTLADSTCRGAAVIGAARVIATGQVVDGDRWWIFFEDSPPTTLFKNSDIQALADKLNAAAGEPTATELEDLRVQLEQERSARAAAEQRAKQAEAGKLHQQLGGQPDGGLTFPYTTRLLEAMRDAATKFWQSHDRSKPAPYGIQKEVQNFLTERTGANSRKVAELAAAIKPDDLPKK
ncbi:MAG: hypothetical protein ACRERX_23965 [Pseudomonas sp.]